MFNSTMFNSTMFNSTMFNSTKFFAAAALLMCGTAANAASVSLVPSSSTVLQSEQFTIDLVLDASEVGGSASSGFVDVTYDPLLVQYDGFVFAAPAKPLAAPTITGSVIESATLGFYDALDTGLIGRFTFTALAPAGATISFGLADLDPTFGTFASEFPANLPIYPDFNGAQVNVVPLPASAWLFLSALGLGLARAKRRITT